MEEIGFKQDSPARIARAPHRLEHRSRRGPGYRPGGDLRPHRRAARLHARSGHHADLRRAAAGVALYPGGSICLPGALPGGRRRWPAGLQPSWSRRHSPIARPQRAGTCSPILLPPRWPVCSIAAASVDSWPRSRLQGWPASLFLPPAPPGSGFSPTCKFSLVFAQSVAPFLPGDAVKVLAASACVSILGSFGDASRDRTL